MVRISKIIHLLKTFTNIKLTFMTDETKLRGGLVISILILLWSTVMWNNDILTIKSQKQTIDSLTKSIDTILIERDSLYQEHFNSEVMNGRYEVSLEYLESVNPKAAKQFTDYMYNETE